MAEIICTYQDGTPVTRLTQWDYNQTIVLSGLELDTVPEIHFSNARMQRAYSVDGTVSGNGVVVRIPNILLQDDGAIILYAYYVYADGSARTKGALIIPVDARPKPVDYVYTEDETGYKSWSELAAEARELMAEMQDIVNSGSVKIDGAVEYDEIQNLNAVQRNRARSNIGIYTSAPSNPKEGDVWFDLSESDGTGVLSGGSGANYGANSSDVAGYIHNRPFWVEDTTITWDGKATSVAIEGAYRISELAPFGDDLTGGTVTFTHNGTNYSVPIVGYYENVYKASAILDSLIGTNSAMVMDGASIGFPAGCPVLVATTTGSGESIFLAAIINRDDVCDYLGVNPGIYAVNTNNTYLTKLRFSASSISPAYSNFFKGVMGGTRLHVVSVEAAAANGIGGLNLGGYQVGDVLLITDPSTAAEVLI